MELTIQVITFIIFLITLSAWSLVGLIFWIPILTRATTIFAGMILYATLTHQNADALREHLHVAISFYADGFRITKTALYPPNDRSVPSKIEFHLGRFIVELLWTAAFWLAILWISKPQLIMPMTAQIGSAVRVLREGLEPFHPVVIISIIVGVLVVFIWGVYLWWRYDYLLNETTEGSYEKLQAGLERIWKSLDRLYRWEDQKRSETSGLLVERRPEGTIQHRLDTILMLLKELSESVRGSQSASSPSSFRKPARSTASRTPETSLGESELRPASQESSNPFDVKSLFNKEGKLRE